MKPRSARGFSLIELVIALNLFLILVGAMMAIQASVLRQQSKVMGQAAVAVAATSVAKAFLTLGPSASHISWPLPGTTANATTLWENFDWTTETAIQAGPMVFRHLCVETVGAVAGVGRLWFYEGPYPMAAIVCGANPAAGVSRTLIAGGGDLGVSVEFSRPLNQANLLHVTCSVALPAKNFREAYTMTNVSQIEIRAPAL